MHSFHFVGDEQLAATKVSGGIAEALIATAAGLTIAILCLIPYNYFTARVAKLQFELQTAGTNLELLFKLSESRELKEAQAARHKNSSGSSSASKSNTNKEHANETAFAAAA
jgi:biopolymer transport protein ExbB